MKNVFLFILLTTVVVGCSKTDNPVVTTPTVELIPLTVGNVWVYRDTGLNGTMPLLQIDTNTITGTQILNGETYYNINNSDSYLLRRGKDYYSLERNKLMLVARYPAAIGDKILRDTIFERTVDVNGNVIDIDTTFGDLTVMETQQPLTVPAGLFSCYKYQIDYASTRYNYVRRDVSYFSPKTGFIMGEVYFGDKQGHLRVANRTELLSATLK